MAGVRCADVRAFLAGLHDAGPTAPVDPSVWTALLGHGAVAGTPDAPALTDIGRHVLAELEVRSARTDPLELEAVAGELGRVLGDLDRVAKTAEYLLADLGPVTPAVALPYLRPVAVNLANRRVPGEELAEAFRQAWGSVEVIGGDPMDRLLAAEILSATDAPIESVYGPLILDAERIREGWGPAHAAAASALLHERPRTDRFPVFATLRGSGLPDEVAALLASTPGAASAIRAQFDAAVEAVESAGAPVASARLAAAYLLGVGEHPESLVPRLAVLRPRLAQRFAEPTLPAAILATLRPLEPPELVDWLDKATEIARGRQLAPSPGELAALGLSLVQGLPATTFATTAPAPPVTVFAAGARALAIHGWLYRDLLGRSAARAAPTPAP